MSMTPEVPQRTPHPARHVLGVPGVAVLAMLILGAFFAAAIYVSSILSGGGMAAVISATLVDLANEDRVKENLTTLRINETLVEAAQAKANDMAAKSYFAHVSPEGIDPWYWFREAGYGYSTAGENLAVNFSDSEDVEQAWMNSPGHRANILNAKFTEIGIATARGEYKGKQTTFVVQMFGTPQAFVASQPQTESVPVDPEVTAVAVASPSENTNILGTEETIAPSPVVEMPPTPAEPAPVYAGPAERLLTSPESLLRVLYIVCGALILIALLLTTQLELKRHHLPRVMAASLLLVAMAGLLIAADAIIFVDPVVTAVAEAVSP